jgi:hypothetical protein
LEQLERVDAEFGPYPEIYPLKEKHFQEHDLKIPVRLKDLIKNNRLYWLRFPIMLKPVDDFPFTKLKCGIEFNPQVQAGHLRPLALMIFPDVKFKKYIEVTDSVEFNIGENAELIVAGGIPSLGQTTPGVKAQAEAKASGRLQVAIGPFNYVWKKAVIDHTPINNAKVFWTLDGTEFLQGDDPNFVVVLQVPKPVDQVVVAAGLKALPRFKVWTADVSKLFRFLTSDQTELIRNGALVTKTKVWDITPSL